MKQTFLSALSVITMIAFFLPLFIVVARKMTKDPFFLAFALYWSFSGVEELLVDHIPFFAVSVPLQRTINTVYNMIDIPFVLAIFYYLTSSLPIKKFTGIAVIGYIALELISIFRVGAVNYEALKYPMGVGLILVLTVVSWEIVRYLQQVEHNNRQNAKVIIYAAVLFEYATFIIVYCIDYYTDDAFYESVKHDIYLIYYISTLIGILISCSGYLLYRKAMREEPIRNEIKIDII